MMMLFELFFLFVFFLVSLVTAAHDDNGYGYFVDPEFGKPVAVAEIIWTEQLLSEQFRTRQFYEKQVPIDLITENQKRQLCIEEISKEQIKRELILQEEALRKTIKENLFLEKQSRKQSIPTGSPSAITVAPSPLETTPPERASVDLALAIQPMESFLSGIRKRLNLLNRPKITPVD